MTFAVAELCIETNYPTALGGVQGYRGAGRTGLLRRDKVKVLCPVNELLQLRAGDIVRQLHGRRLH